MAVPFSNTKLRVPQGMRNLLHILAREAIRDQPPDLIQHANDLMQKLLCIRIQTGHDPVVDGVHVEDRYYNNYSFKELQYDPNDPATVEAAIRIQASYKGFKVRKYLKQQSTLRITSSIDINLDDPAVANAAIKIQAGFRGHLVRKELKGSSSEKITEAPASSKTTNRPPPLTSQYSSKYSSKPGSMDINMDDPAVNQAAIKIQAQYKGYKVRKELKDVKQT